MLAAAEGDASIVQMLLRAGARRDLYDNVRLVRARLCAVQVKLIVVLLTAGLPHCVGACAYPGVEGSHRDLP
jgi:hypothetical protein